MKRISVLLALLLLMVGCTTQSPSSNLPPNMRIGLCLYKQEDTFIATVLGSFEQEVRSYEQQTGAKVTLKVMDAKGSQSTQNEQVDRLIALDYDMICVNIVDRTAAAVIIDRAKSADIPVIFFNREPVLEDLERWEKVYYVGAVASESGILQGQLVADAYTKGPETIDRNGDGKLQYVMLEGEPGHQDALLRTEFSVKAVTSEGIGVEKLANDTANWHRGQAATRMTQWIHKFGNSIEVVFCNNDDMALGAIDAYQAANIARLPLIVGVDATPPALEAVRAGTLAGTVKNDGEGQAKAMLSLCNALATGQDPAQAVEFSESRCVRLPYQTVTLDTLPKNEKENRLAS